ncbi:MAG: hypothetical protein ACTSYF_04750 [Promethearchaeota archaeon]
MFKEIVTIQDFIRLLHFDRHQIINDGSERHLKMKGKKNLQRKRIKLPL